MGSLLTHKWVPSNVVEIVRVELTKGLEPTPRFLAGESLPFPSNPREEGGFALGWGPLRPSLRLGVVFKFSLDRFPFREAFPRRLRVAIPRRACEVFPQAPAWKSCWVTLALRMALLGYD